VRSALVVIDSPRFHFLRRIDKGPEPMNVQALVPKATIERFDVRIVCRFARS
jgi:hypothetical protein